MDAVVFDWDGTLVDSLGAVFRANQAVFAAIDLPFDEALYRQHYTPDWRVMYRRLGIPEERLAEANDRWLEALGETPPAKPFPGTVDALRRLRSRGIALGLVTAGHRAVVERQLVATGIGDLISVRVYGDDLPVHKPDPRPLRVALSELGVAGRPADAAYVGDAPDDMRLAVAVGVRGIAVASKLGTPDEMRAAGAAAVVPSVAAWVDEALAGNAESTPAGAAAAS
ncbi:MAG: HAD family hydrolase [Chloroflexota bacterium]